MNSAMNQSECEAITCNRRQARENACGHVMIGFGLASHWLKKWREFCQPSRQNVVKQNQSKREITFDTQLKTALISHQFIRELLFQHYLRDTFLALDFNFVLVLTASSHALFHSFGWLLLWLVNICLRRQWSVRHGLVFDGAVASVVAVRTRSQIL